MASDGPQIPIWNSPIPSGSILPNGIIYVRVPSKFKSLVERLVVDPSSYASTTPISTFEYLNKIKWD